MIRFCVFGWLLFSVHLQLVSAAKCPTSFSCGKLRRIEFPYTTTERPECGILAIGGCDDPNPMGNQTIRLNNTAGESLDVLEAIASNIVVRDNNLHKYLNSQSHCCEAFKVNLTLSPSSPLASFQIENNITIFRCNHSLNISPPQYFLNYPNCSDYNIFYPIPNKYSSIGSVYSRFFAACSTIQLPVKDLLTDSDDPSTFLTAQFTIHARSDCDNCQRLSAKWGNRCQFDSGKIHCVKAADKTWVWKMGLGIAIGLLSLMIVLLMWYYKRRLASSELASSEVELQTRNSSSYSNIDQESSSTIYFGVPIFSYKDLLETTNNFDANRKLGDGGFGTVYYGKLQDGREVAIKRLHDHNYKRVQQFMNEVEILTRLRHKNLVSLYGCTSTFSHELLLVYEYIPNGTIASHLHGHLANLGLLSWPTRLKIAIETASALAYLHASDIIHRDIKTNNILLDNNYSVKVADFGLSRLFPNDVSHVSTAPQGTPGYVDPEYHLCHQLTSKSDVYSFGVVLVELISSMPPINMTRQKDEINLANLAMKKIRNDAISEMVDPSLGFHSNNDVKRTIILVAELAFWCLQWENELRPSMDEALEVLNKIQSEKDELGDLAHVYVHKEGTNSYHINVKPPSDSLDCDEIGLLKGVKSMPSPTTVIGNRESESTYYG